MTTRKENVHVSSTLPREKINYSKVERKQWPTGLKFQKRIHFTLSNRCEGELLVSFSQPVSRMFATVLEWLKDFLTGAIKENRKAARSKADTPLEIGNNTGLICKHSPCVTCKTQSQGHVNLKRWEISKNWTQSLHHTLLFGTYLWGAFAHFHNYSLNKLSPPLR